MNRVSKRSFLKGLCSLPLLSFAGGAKASESWQSAIGKALGRKQDFRVCFGSCHFHEAPQTHWKKIYRRRPDLWLWLGDNIYGDTRDIKELEAKYQTVLDGPYGEFRKKVPVDGIWDDHDFGEDGANSSYPLKKESQDLHLNFLGVPEVSTRREQEGIYHTREILNGAVKYYFLDTRYFKDTEKGRGHSLLGETQWQWLEQEMATSQAKVNIFVTPIGFLLNRLFVTEDWAEYLDDKERLLKLIGLYNLSGAFFMSGDKHFGSFIKRSWDRMGEDVDYFEFQSSGLTHVAPDFQLKAVRKLYGKRNTVIQKNFGQIDFYQEGDHFFMVWTLYSLESLRRLSRVFYLDKNGLWQRPE